MFCIHCGKELKDGMAFCTNCGKPVSGNATNHGEGSNIEVQQVIQQTEQYQQVSESEQQAPVTIPPMVEWGTQTIDTKQKTSKLKYMLPLAILIPVAIVISCLLLFFLPGSARINRHLNLGQKYLSELNYEDAIAEFDMAIAIDDRCVEAYLGKLEAYVEMGDEGNTIDYYEELLDTVEGWDEDYIDEVEDEVVDIFLISEDVYPDDLDMQFAVLERGLAILADNDSLIAEFLHVGIKLIDYCIEEDEYEDGLDIIDKLLSYSEDNEVIERLEDCLHEYLDWLIENQNYDRALELIDKYSDLVDGLDSYQRRIEELVKYYDVLTDCLTEIAKCYSNGDYDAVFDIMHSDNYYEIISYVDEVGEVYAFETDYGKVGVYKSSSVSYGNYFVYVGDYDGKSRAGEGGWLAYYNGNNYHAVGEWVNDSPDGHQLVREWCDRLDESVVYRVIEGGMNKGLWDGPVMWNFEEADGVHSYPVEFNDGIWVVLDIDSDGMYIVCDTKDEEGQVKRLYTESIGGTHGLAGYSDND